MKLKRPADARNWKHGLAKSPEYLCWQHLRFRCTNPKNKSFPDYGGRGVTFCKRWEKFENFYADMGPKPSRLHSIDRIDNDGDYKPSNCRWATKLEQNNNSGNCRRLTHDGVTDTVTGWADRLGCNVAVLFNRLHRGWPAADTLSPPFDRNRTKLKSKRLKWQGEELTVPQLAKLTGIPRNVINYRLSAGWTFKEALTTPRAPHVRK